MNPLLRILIVGLASVLSTASFAADNTKEEIYTCTEGNDPSEGVVSVYMKDGTSLFRGDALVKNGRILRIGGVITNSRVDLSQLKDETKKVTTSVNSSSPNAVPPRAGDQVSRIEPIGHTVGQNELRPGDKVPPQTGAALGQTNAAFFDAGIDANGELRAIRWQSWQKPASGAALTTNTAFDAMTPSPSEQEKRYLKSTQMYLTQFRRFVSCCDNPNQGQCKTVERAAQPLPPAEVPLQQPSFGTQSPFR